MEDFSQIPGREQWPASSQVNCANHQIATATSGAAEPRSYRSGQRTPPKVHHRVAIAHWAASARE
jgi:hypothetical protein